MAVGREFGGSDDDVGLKAEIAFGMDCDSWMQSQIGRYLRRMADQEIAGFKDDLATTDADNVSLIRSIQSEIRVRQQVFEWLRSAVQSGLAAQTQALEQGSL